MDPGVEPVSGPVPPRNDLDARVMGATLARRMFGEDVGAPIRIGRFIVLDRIGGGGMGTVFRAYDPQLDRRVAVKLLRPEIARDDPNAQRRMQREAVALAKLSHPHVVTIHEVDTIDGQTFLAMEYVDGVDVAQWMLEHPVGSSARFAEAMDLLQQAGRGLVAAHSAGLVHRDFKPSNVLVGKDGRVRVADFGLVRAAGWCDDAGDSISGGSPDDSRVTQAGVMLGTVRYMAPEQQRGDDVDARSDQYSFCVTAWELLLGTSPWASGADTISVPDGAPRWIVALLQRGLHVDPAHRHPDMQRLLDALRRDPRKRRWIAVGSFVAAVAAGAVVTTIAHRRATLCDDGPAALAQVWNDERRTALERHFAELGVDGADEAWTRSAARFDGLAHEWSATRDAVCDGGRRRGEIPAAEMEATFGCLDVRLAELDAALVVLESSGVEIAAGAVALAYGVGSPARCADGRTHDAMRLPTDADRAHEVLALLRQLTEIRLIGEASDWDGALERLDAIDPQIEATDHFPLWSRAAMVRIDALERLGRAHEANDLVELAYWRALENGEDAMASALAAISATIMLRLEDHAAAADRLQYARVLGERAGVGDDERSRIEAVAARLSTVVGDYPEARRHSELAVALAEAAWGADHPATATALVNRAAVLYRQDDFVGSVEAARRALAIREVALGRDALSSVSTRRNLASGLARLGRLDESLALDLEVLDAFTQWFGPHDRRVGSTLGDLGATSLFAARHADAAGYLRRAIAVFEARGSPDHENVLLARHNLAIALMGLDQFEEAIAIERDVLRRYEQVHGPDHPRVALALWGLGQALDHAGSYDEAERVLDRSHRIWLAKEEPNGADTLGVEISRAKLDLHRDRADAALASIDALLPRTTGANVRAERGDALFLRGEILERLGRADDARASYQESLAFLLAPKRRAEAQQRIDALSATRRRPLQ